MKRSTHYPDHGISSALRDDLQRYYETRMGGAPDQHVIYVQNFFESSVPGFQAGFVFNDGVTRPAFTTPENLYGWLVSQGWFFHPSHVPLSIRRMMEEDAQVRRLDGLPPLPKPADSRLKFPTKLEGTTK